MKLVRTPSLFHSRNSLLNPLSLIKSTSFLLLSILSFSAPCLCAQSKVLSVTSNFGNADYANSDSITVDSNESVLLFTTVVEYESESYTSDARAFIQYENADGTWANLFGKENLKTDQAITLQGPCKFRLSAKSHYYYSNGARWKWVKYTAFYNITPKEKEAPSKKFATVIPENASTNIRVVLEQSTDLINWTAASPGVFPPSTAKRFFRVRSEEE